MSVSFGTTQNGEITGIRYKPRQRFSYTIHIPDECRNSADNALLINHDGLNEAEVIALKRLADENKAPHTVTIGLVSGTLYSDADGGSDRNMRMRNMRMDDYDLYTSEYADFLVYECIPKLLSEHGISISDSPDMHIISGGSSGGISAFQVALFHSDYFHRVYMSSPSFLSMGKGNEIPAIVRKLEAQPLRVWTEYSENEPDDYFGSSFCAAMEIERALRFAGYTFHGDYFKGEGHCSRRGDAEHLYKVYEYLWEDYADKPVAVERLSPRCEVLLSTEEQWRPETDFPSEAPIVTDLGQYVIRGNAIVFVDKSGAQSIFADDFKALTSIALSSDKWRLYAADLEKGCLYACTILSDGSSGGRYVHGALHMKTDFRHPGANSICVDRYDRVFAATEIGIQAVRSFGLIDCIIATPKRQAPLKVTLLGERLFVQCENAIYSRKLRTEQAHGTVQQPKFGSYYD